MVLEEAEIGMPLAMTYPLLEENSDNCDLILGCGLVAARWPNLTIICQSQSD